MWEMCIWVVNINYRCNVVTNMVRKTLWAYKYKKCLLANKQYIKKENTICRNNEKFCMKIYSQRKHWLVYSCLMAYRAIVFYLKPKCITDNRRIRTVLGIPKRSGIKVLTGFGIVSSLWLNEFDFGLETRQRSPDMQC